MDSPQPPLSPVDGALPASDSRHFYRDLAPFHSFVDGVFSAAVYRAVPPDWVVLVADIAGSTRAVERGRYAEVNYLGAACIVAANNALSGLEIPAVFGGDGATVVVPARARDTTLKALLATRRWGSRAFGLELRVGAVPISALMSNGGALEVAKLQFSPRNTMAMFRGNGLDLADALIKGDDGSAGFRVDAGADDLAAPDLDNLSCRWAPMASANGVVLSLILAAKTPTLGASDAIYREALSRIHGIAPLDDAASSPVKLAGLRRPLRLSAMRKEVAHEPGLRWQRWPRVMARHLVQGLVFWLDLGPGGFDPHRYRRDVVINADYRKVSGMLRLILDCTPTQANDIERALCDMQREGKLHFGTHRAREAIMTCVTPNVDNHEHVHFIDGGDGGLYLAARALKERMAGTPPANPVEQAEDRDAV